MNLLIIKEADNIPVETISCYMELNPCLEVVVIPAGERINVENMASYMEDFSFPPAETMIVGDDLDFASANQLHCCFLFKQTFTEIFTP